MVGLPFLGYFANRFYVSEKQITPLPKIDWSEYGVSEYGLDIIPATGYSTKGDKIRIGVVGIGGRGVMLLESLGHVSKEWAEKNTKNGLPNPALKKFLDQEDLNVEITGVCDTCSIRAQAAADIIASPVRSGKASQAKSPKIYPSYRDMLQDDNLDAIIIATPDFWHEKMAVDAALAGKHVYIEKPMCQTVDEAKNLSDIVRKTGIIFQVGHQNRQQASYIMAKKMFEKNVLGPVSLIETYTNRNSDGGAWIRGIEKGANASNVNWKEFLGDKPWREFDLDRYFNWQKWFEYGTGPAGNQFTHRYDCINQIMNLGIPKTVVATGGNFYFKDPRDIPDVLNAVFLYPDRGLSLTYDCVLRNSNPRPITIMGQEGTMKVSAGLEIFSDSYSKNFNQFNEHPEVPIFAYNSRNYGVDALTSATAKSYSESGFGYTSIKGEIIDTTFLHLKEWLYGIRKGVQPSCNVEKGFEETVTFYMSNLAYLEKRVVEWDAENEKII